MKKYDVVIAGAGIVGLAAAHKLQQAYSQLRIAVLDKEQKVGCHQTGHNSGVIHSGVYYRPGSLKALNCIRGYQLLLDYLRENTIEHKICGKLIVATNLDQLSPLETIYQRGLSNGLTDLRLLSREQSREVEPKVNAEKSLWVPQAGIVDFQAVSAHLYQSLKVHGVDFFFESCVEDIREQKSLCHIITPGQIFECKCFINCAGLYSDRLAEMALGPQSVRIIPFRGEYYQLKPESRDLVENLIYPVPDSRFPFLGVHFTRQINGNVEAGPNAVLALGRESYKWKDINLDEVIDLFSWPGFYRVAGKYWDTGLKELFRSLSKASFTKSLQELIPEISESDLIDGGSGVRAQACGRDGTLLDDFLIVQGANSIHVVNAPSPAATSCLSIGETICGLYKSKTQ